MFNVERTYPPPPKDTLMREYGVHRLRLNAGQLVTCVSGGTWEEFRELLKGITDEDRIVVTPELMTLTDHPFEALMQARYKVDQRICEVTQVSEDFPEAIFLLGTPDFVNGGKPKNSVLYIKGGEVIGSTNKRAGALEDERKHFSFNASEPPSMIPGTNLAVLICSDFPMSSVIHYGDQRRVDRLLELSGKTNLIGKKLTFISPRAKGIIVPSCWGVVGNSNFTIAYTPDEYYKNQLLATSNIVFGFNSSIEEIVVVDRVPDLGEALQQLTPDKPYNALIQRS